jgi:hypothetical protein
MASATRTQIYLTREQRARLDELAAREGKTLAQVIREAVDAYIAGPSRASRDAVLDATFGAAPDIEVPPREEWDRRGG